MAGETPEAEHHDDEANQAYWQGTLVVPSVFVNHVALMPNGVGLRLTFGETLPSGPIYPRSAVLIGDWQAYELWQLLGDSDAVRRVQNFIEAEKANESQT